MKEEKTIHNYKSINKMRCISGIVMGSIIISLSLLALILNVANYYNDDVPEAGMGTLRMFTTLSNLLVCGGAFLSIPFQIDGLRKNNYHLPIWIVSVLYIGTLGVALTFIVAIGAISIAQGFVVTMFSKSNIFLHTINPILAIILFTFINCDHHVKFYQSFITLVPLAIYAIVYLVMAIIIGEENGGWRDVYQFNTYIPWYVSLVMMTSIAFGLSNLLRFLHNKKHKNTKEAIRNYYLKSPVYSFDTIEEAVSKLAKENKEDYIGGNIEIPVRVINMFNEKYNYSGRDEELINKYIYEFYSFEK